MTRLSAVSSLQFECVRSRVFRTRPGRTGQAVPDYPPTARDGRRMHAKLSIIRDFVTRPGEVDKYPPIRKHYCSTCTVYVRIRRRNNSSNGITGRHRERRARRGAQLCHHAGWWCAVGAQRRGEVDARRPACTQPEQEKAAKKEAKAKAKAEKKAAAPAAPKKAAPAKPPAPAAEEEDDDDFWGEDEEQTEEEKAAAAKELEEAKAKAMAKLAKKEANQRSLSVHKSNCGEIHHATPADQVWVFHLKVGLPNQEDRRAPDLQLRTGRYVTSRSPRNLTLERKLKDGPASGGVECRCVDGVVAIAWGVRVTRLAQ